MAGPITFTLQFKFEDGDHAKALKLHQLLKKYGVVGNVTHPKELGVDRKEERLESILNCMMFGETYTTGKLWCKYGRYTRAGIKTFQRDLNTLLVMGRVNGASGIHPTKKGRTFFWTRGDTYGKYPSELEGGKNAKQNST